MSPSVADDGSGVIFVEYQRKSCWVMRSSEKEKIHNDAADNNSPVRLSAAGETEQFMTNSRNYENKLFEDHDLQILCHDSNIDNELWQLQSLEYKEVILEECVPVIR